MSLFIGFLIAVMVIVCLLLILLVLMQLPKKEAGAGLAFGGGATDALFGSGSGNVLTKATKYSAVAFFVLAIFISILQNHNAKRSVTDFQEQLRNPQNQAIIPATQPPASAPVPADAPATNNLNLMLPGSTNVP